MPFWEEWTLAEKIAAGAGAVATVGAGALIATRGSSSTKKPIITFVPKFQCGPGPVGQFQFVTLSAFCPVVQVRVPASPLCLITAALPKGASWPTGATGILAEGPVVLDPRGATTQVAVVEGTLLGPGSVDAWAQAATSAVLSNTPPPPPPPGSASWGVTWVDGGKTYTTTFIATGG